MLRTNYWATAEEVKSIKKESNKTLYYNRGFCFASVAICSREVSRESFILEKSTFLKIRFLKGNPWEMALSEKWCCEISPSRKMVSGRGPPRQGSQGLAGKIFQVSPPKIKPQRSGVWFGEDEQRSEWAFAQVRKQTIRSLWGRAGALLRLIRIRKRARLKASPFLRPVTGYARDCWYVPCSSSSSHYIWSSSETLDRDTRYLSYRRQRICGCSLSSRR